MDAFEGLFEIHIVEACAPQGNELHAVFNKLVNDGLADGVVDKRADGIEAGGQVCGIAVEVGIIVGDVYTAAVIDCVE